MIIDDLDISLISLLYNLKKDEELDTKYELVKKLFPELNDYERKKKYTNIKRKLQKFEKYGLIKIEIEGDNRNRILQIQNIDFKKFKFKDGFKKVICLKILDEWSAFELSH